MARAVRPRPHRHIEAGVPIELAARIAGLGALNAALDIVELAARRGRLSDTAHVYFEVGARIGLDWLRDQLERLPVEGSWQAVARTELRDGLFRAHRRIAESVLAGRTRGGVHARVDGWLEHNQKALKVWQSMLADMRAVGNADFATLTVGLECVRKLTD